MNHQHLLTRFLIAVVVFALCGAPEVAMAFAAQDPAAQSQQQTASTPLGTEQQPPTTQPVPTTVPDTGTPQQPVQQQPGQSGTTVDPSQGPLTPVPSQDLPTAPSATAPAAQQPSSAPAGQQQPTSREPLGAAAAEGISTAGGGASRPAGAAIAPAKQRQMRSFLIKLGAIAAAGAAIGTIYALSKGTPSTPPNSGR